MRKGWALALAVSILSGPASGAGLTAIPSRLLDRTVPIAVHVPAGDAVARWRSAHPGQPLQLVLFLPGAFDGPKDFLKQGLDAHLSKQEAEGHLPPSLWVAVTHFQSWYADRADGGFPFESWNPILHLGGSVALVVGCGTEDKYDLANACRAFAKACKARNRPLQLELRPGGHDWAYWTPAFKAWMPWLLNPDTPQESRAGSVAKSE